MRLSRSSVPADDITPVEVVIQLRDRNGYPMVARDVVLTLSGTGNTVVQPDPTDPDGATTASFRSNTGEIKSLSVVVPSTDGGPDVTLAQALEVRFNASQIVFTVQPAATTALQPNISAEVTLRDAAGNVVTSDTNSVTLSGLEGAGLWGQTTVAPTAGVAAFDSLSIDLTGSRRLSASSAELEAVSDPFAVASYYTALATLLSTVSACDDCSQAVALAAPFEFFGVLYGTANVTSNGLASMTSTASPFNNATIPSAAAPNALLALFWDDLNPSAAGDVYYASDATSTAIEYRGVAFFSSSTSAVTLEMRLFTGEDAALALLPGDIVFIFHTLSHPTDANRPLGGSATVGVENADGTAGTLISFNSTQVVQNGRHLVLRYNGTGYDRIR